MSATAVNLIERVLPQSGLRQWVLTFFRSRGGGWPRTARSSAT
jgi:hypothetical protein